MCNTKISSSLWTCLHHLVKLRSSNKITDFFMILACCVALMSYTCMFQTILHCQNKPPSSELKIHFWLRFFYTVFKLLL